MVPLSFTTASDWLASLLVRWASKGYTPNVSLGDEGTPPIGLKDGERMVALVQAADGREFLLTGERVVEEGDTVLKYGDILRCHWITDHPDPWEHARLKRTHPHRLILDLRDGRKVVLDQLGQAVFPLLRFFESISSANLSMIQADSTAVNDEV